MATAFYIWFGEKDPNVKKDVSIIAINLLFIYSYSSNVCQINTRGELMMLVEFTRLPVVAVQDHHDIPMLNRVQYFTVINWVVCTTGVSKSMPLQEHGKFLLPNRRTWNDSALSLTSVLATNLPISCHEIFGPET